MQFYCSTRIEFIFYSCFAVRSKLTDLNVINTSRFFSNPAEIFFLDFFVFVYFPFTKLMSIYLQKMIIILMTVSIKKQFPQRKYLFENLHASSTTRKSTSGPSGLKIKGCISYTHNKDIMIIIFFFVFYYYIFKLLCAFMGS